jgi:outer membrane protein assembly factor BamB
LILLLTVLAFSDPSDPFAQRRAELFPEPDPKPAPAAWPGPFLSAPVLQWSRPLPGRRVNSLSYAERSRPLIVGEHLWLGTAGTRALWVLSRRDGTVVRRLDADGVVEAEPVLDGDRVYYTDTAGSTWCRDLQGGLIWRKEGTSPQPTRVVPAGALVLVRDVDGLLVALDRGTGEQRWQYRRRQDPTRASELTLYAAPPPVVTGNLALVGFSDGGLVGLDARTGDPQWEVRVGEGRYPDLVASPTIDQGTLLVSGYGNPLVALDLVERGVRWRVEAGAANAGALAETPDGLRLFLHPGTDGVLRAIEPVTGDVRWTWDSGRGAALTTPIVTEAGVLVGSSGGTLALVGLEDGVTRWSWAESFVLEGLTHPPAVEGRQMVFISNAGRIYAMLSPEPAGTWPRGGSAEQKFQTVRPPPISERF